MTTNNRTVRIFITPQNFPCGEQSSCCGPVGQTDEEIEALKSAVEKELDCQFEVVDVTNGEILNKHREASQLVRTFGLMALPVITLDDEVVSMGSPEPQQAVSAIRSKMNER